MTGSEQSSIQYADASSLAYMMITIGPCLALQSRRRASGQTHDTKDLIGQPLRHGAYTLNHLQHIACVNYPGTHDWVSGVQTECSAFFLMISHTHRQISIITQFHHQPLLTYGAIANIVCTGISQASHAPPCAPHTHKLVILVFTAAARSTYSVGAHRTRDSADS